jgi:hypothetical protein
VSLAALIGLIMDKRQIPSTKFQINSNGRNSKSSSKFFGSFGFGVWDLFEIWSLEFGI